MTLTANMTSLWAATADPAIETPPLSESIMVDVAVIGGGYTGLATALRLAEGGTSVAVLEAHEPGFGASGLNGGQVIPGLKYDPDELEQKYGKDIVPFVGNVADVVFKLIETYNISCDPIRAGWIQPAFKRSHLPMLQRRAEQWARRGANVEFLSRDQVGALTGSEAFCGGWIDRRGGSLHPLNYVRGLARAAQSKGARIYGRTQAVKLHRESGRWSVGTANGPMVTAENVVIATNAYTDDLWPQLRQTVVPARSMQIATAPLGDNLRQAILPERSVVSDSGRVTNYFRIGPQGRLLMGGRGSFAEPQSPRDYASLFRAIKRIFPAAAEMPIEYYWSGRVALTYDFLPHLHQPAPGITIMLGYNGRGVAMSTAAGLAIGTHLLDPANPLPLKPAGIKPIPLHRFHEPITMAYIHYYRLRDALDR